jgi:hypothetical protein
VSSGIETIADGLEHGGHTGFYVVGGDSQDTIAACFQLAFTFGVCVSLFCVDRPINLDDQALYGTAEVSDKGSNRVPATKGVSVQLAAS